MRPIKFRAWDKEKKYMVINAVEFRPDRVKNTLLGNDYEYMQFTGLLDKNGKEIYEGDIVLYNEWIVPEKYPNFYKVKDIKWDPAKAKFIIGEGDTWGMIYGSHQMEVIGNIYENPELLKEPSNV